RCTQWLEKGLRHRYCLWYQQYAPCSAFALRRDAARRHTMNLALRDSLVPAHVEVWEPPLSHAECAIRYGGPCVWWNRNVLLCRSELWYPRASLRARKTARAR